MRHKVTKSGRAATAGLIVCASALAACAGGGGNDGGSATASPATVSPNDDIASRGLHTGSGVRQAVSLTQASAADSVVAATWRAGFAALAASGGPASDQPAGAVVSPASLVVALAMLGEGATGDSVAAFDQALGASGQARTDAVNALTASLAQYEGDPGLVQATDLPDTPMVHVANQVVVTDGVTLQQRYLDRLIAGYGAGVLVTDLSSDTGTQDLDAWVNQNSGGLIKHTAIVPDPDLVLVLQNAVALAAAWQQPFDADLTGDEPFTLADGTQVAVPTMDAELSATYVTQNGWQAVRLPYAGGSLYADIFLPPEGSAAARNPATADPATVAALTAALDTMDQQLVLQQVVVSLPTVDMAVKLDLLPTLHAVGLGRLTDPDTADLGGILAHWEGEPPYVGQAWQQAVLQVDEAGTRAAAVTELGVIARSAPAPGPPPVVFTVDRPYLFVVADGHTDWPLFLASVLDPRG